MQFHRHRERGMRLRHLEEGDARSCGQFAVAAENFARAGFAATGQEVLAQFDQALGEGCRLAAPVARQQRAAPLGNGLQKFSKERGVHRDVSMGAI